MAALNRLHAQGLIDASLATTALAASTSPIKCRLYTTSGTENGAGTEVSGGSYVTGGSNVTFAAATNAAPPVASSSSLLSYTGMPACTVVAVGLYDSNTTPKRLWFGDLAASKVLNSGDTFQIASGSLTCSLA
jgi:hypothetical protein